MAMTDVGMIQDFVVTTPEYESGDFEHEPHETFSVSHVYDMASEIGKDFELLIDAYGVESIQGIMPKVITALEQLERLTRSSEAMEETMLEFKSIVENLETEKRQKARDRMKYERDLEALDERYRSENERYRAENEKLLMDNKRLSMSLRHSDSFHNFDRGHPDGEETEGSATTMLIEKLQQKLTLSDSQIASKSADLDSALAQNVRLTGLMKELRRKIKYSQACIRSTAEEKAELQAAVQIQKKEINTLKCQLKILNQEKARNTTGTCKVGDVDAEILQSNSNVKGEESDVPCFTATELKEIIWERNSLKTKLSDLTDIIAALKKNDSSGIEESTSKDDDDAPVQGPLPYEPEDAPWKRTDSGVRTFFRKLFGSTDTPFSFL